MFDWLCRKCRTKIGQLAADELYICERQLLEAEGQKERATANVRMLSVRRARLVKAVQRCDQIRTSGNTIVDVERSLKRAQNHAA